MNIKNLFSGNGTIDKVIDVIEKVVPDAAQKSQAKFEIYKIIASNMVAKWVRAIITLMFFIVWLFFPEKLTGREEMVKYMIYAIAGYYFIIDRSMNQIKRKNYKD